MVSGNRPRTQVHTHMKIYVWIDGEEFSPHRFEEESRIDLGGQVCSRKRIENGSEVEGPAYWRSKILEVDLDSFDQKFQELIGALIVLKNSIPSSARVVAQVSSEFRNNEDVVGYYLSPTLVSALAELGAALDIDINEKVAI